MVKRLRGKKLKKEIRKAVKREMRRQEQDAMKNG